MKLKTTPTDPKLNVPDTLTAMQPDEQQILTITRHPAGIIALYALSGLIVVATAVLAFGVGPSVFSGDGEGQVILGSGLVFGLVSALCIIVAAIATKIYRANIWILTKESLTQVDQPGLFRRESSQLSLEHIEDVTSEQNGMVPRMFNYGVLRVAIPGESDKFVFPFCPNPNYYAAQILHAREDFMERPQGAKLKPQAPPVEPPIVSYEVPDGSE